jgi:hypothetical protein
MMPRPAAGVNCVWLCLEHRCSTSVEDIGVPGLGRHWCSRALIKRKKTFDKFSYQKKTLKEIYIAISLNL